MEDQPNDRLSFQKYARINYIKTVPDFTTILRFKEALIRERLMDGLFALILVNLESKTRVDATIIQVHHQAVEQGAPGRTGKKPKPANKYRCPTNGKAGKKYFGYKDYIGTDVCNDDLIRKRVFTSVRPITAYSCETGHPIPV